MAAEPAASRLTLAAQERLGQAVASNSTSFPACSFAIADVNGVLHTGAFGSIDGVPATPITSSFPAASISKTVVAALVLESSQRGVLNLDTHIGHWLPFSWQLRNPHFPDDLISARHLLQHRSGLRDDETALQRGQWRTEGADCHTLLSECIRVRFGPGACTRIWTNEARPGSAAYHYSNAGFAILGLALETANDLAAGGLETLAQERLFKPLGMTRSSFFLEPLLLTAATEVAAPLQEGCQSPEHYGVCEYPAASLRSTAEDLAKFLRAHILPTDVPKDEVRVLPCSSLEELMPPRHDDGKLRGGLAWWGADGYGDRRGVRWEHGGFMDGVRSHAYVWPQHKVAAVILGNSNGEYAWLTDSIIAALSEHLGFHADCF